eukprot:3154459-Rhodomonas_salina.1
MPGPDLAFGVLPGRRKRIVTKGDLGSANPGRGQLGISLYAHNASASDAVNPIALASSASLRAAITLNQRATTPVPVLSQLLKGEAPGGTMEADVTATIEAKQKPHLSSSIGNRDSHGPPTPAPLPPPPPPLHVPAPAAIPPNVAAAVQTSAPPLQSSQLHPPLPQLPPREKRPIPAPAEQAPQQEEEKLGVGGLAYIVQGGDTMTAIAKKHHVPLSGLLAVNAETVRNPGPPPTSACLPFSKTALTSGLSCA